MKSGRPRRPRPRSPPPPPWRPAANPTPGPQPTPPISADTTTPPSPRRRASPAKRRSQGDGAARRALRQRLRRTAGRRRRRRLVPPRRRPRRPRGHVRARHVPLRRPRRRRAIATEAAKLLAAATRLGHPPPPTISRCSISRASCSRRTARAAELFRIAADVGSPEAQYALATSTRKAAASPRTGEAAAAPGRGQPPAISTPRSNMRSRCSTAPASKDEAAPPLLMRKAARRGSPIAQNRLARILAAGRGLPADPVEAIKWHLIAKAAGASDDLARRLHAEAQKADRCGRREGRAALDRSHAHRPRRAT